MRGSVSAMSGLRCLGVLLSLVVLASAPPGAAGQRDPALADGAKAKRAWTGDGLRLELAPLLSDQVRAFFIGRGFSAADAAFIAREGCMFRSAIGSAFDSAGAPMVVVPLDRWRAVRDGRREPLRTREQWTEIWKTRGADATARVAFHWALFPTRAEFAPTDYNWGMLAFGLPPGSRFDLEIRWRTGPTEFSKRLEKLECAE